MQLQFPGVNPNNAAKNMEGQKISSIMTSSGMWGKYWTS